MFWSRTLTSEQATGALEEPSHVPEVKRGTAVPRSFAHPRRDATRRVMVLASFARVTGMVQRQQLRRIFGCTRTRAHTRTKGHAFPFSHNRPRHLRRRATKQQLQNCRLHHVAPSRILCFQSPLGLFLAFVVAYLGGHAKYHFQLWLIISSCRSSSLCAQPASLRPEEAVVRARRQRRYGSGSKHVGGEIGEGSRQQKRLSVCLSSW